MKRFRFRLQRVLDVRERMRDEARQELVVKNAARDEAQRVLAELEQSALQSTVKEGGTYSASDLLMLGDYHARLKREIAYQEEVVARAEAEAEEARAKYVAASQDAKSIEMLKQKRLVEYRDEALKQEGADIDELTVQRHGRKNKSGM
jgi:flagellar FliJ protein